MHYRLAETIAQRTIGGETFVYDRAHGVIHTFNDTGTFIWSMLSASTPLDEIPERLREEFDVTRDEADNDVARFINLLEENHLLRLGCEE